MIELLMVVGGACVVSCDPSVTETSLFGNEDTLTNCKNSAAIKHTTPNILDVITQFKRDGQLKFIYIASRN